MSSNFNMNANQDNYENDYLSYNQPYNNYYPEQNFDINPFSSKTNKSQQINFNQANTNYNENYSSAQIRRNTMPVFPFPRDSNLEEFNSKGDISSIPPEQKIRKVTKIQPRKKSGFGLNLNNNNNIFKNKYNLGLKKKDISSENNTLKIKQSLMDEFSGISSNNKKLLSKSENESVDNVKKIPKKNNLQGNNNDNNNNAHQNINNNINNNKKIISNKRKNIPNIKITNTTPQNIPKNSISDDSSIDKKTSGKTTLSSMFNKMSFLQNLNKKCEERLKLFEKKYQNDIYFKKKDFFNNVFINNIEIDKSIPLSMIFHYLLNPKKEINQFSLKKCFFENVLHLHGYKNIKIVYDENILNQVPQYFKDLNYVNNLFNKFNSKEFFNFINEIQNWINIFTCEITYKDFSTNDSINDQIKIYLISPQDITIEYNSCTSNSKKSYAEYNFHCDIGYDENQDKFTFKTIANVYNKCDELYQYEYLGEIWERGLIVINSENQKNKLNKDKLFDKEVQKTLNESKTNNNYIVTESIDIKKDKNIKSKNLKNQKENNKENNKDQNLIINKTENKNVQKITKENLIDKNKNENIINNNPNKANEQILFYGVLLSFFLFIFKTVLSFEMGTFSLETFFNIIIIFFIGFMLFKNQSSLN